MAEIKFSCPRCGQHIQCDELCGGQQLACPSCQGELVVPQKVSARGAEAPKPIPPPAPKLAINQPHPPPSRAPTPAPVSLKSKSRPGGSGKSPVVKFAIIGAILTAVAAGIYFGWGLVSDWQQKANAKRRAAEKNADGGQVGHIADLYDVLDRTDPDRGRVRAETRPTGPRQRGGGPRAITVGGEGADGTEAAAAAEKALPLASVVYSLDIESVKLPEGRANGTISGTNFVVQTARLNAVSGAQLLRLTEGSAASPDREILLYLHPKAGEKITNYSLTISKDTRGSGLPSITKRWKTNPKFAPQSKSFTSGYALKIELGPPTDGVLPGKLFLALPDAEQTVVAGSFKAALASTDSSGEPLMAPTPPPGAPPALGVSPAEKAAMERRYGPKR